MKVIFTAVFVIAFFQSILAQDTMYVSYEGVVSKFVVDKVDSVYFFKPIPKEIVADIEGNEYEVLTIGEQKWMASNLRTSKLNDGTTISEIAAINSWNSTSSAAYSSSDTTESYLNNYGVLYNFYAVETGKLCPNGWKVPSNSDWLILANNLGGTSLAGKELKPVDGTNWEMPYSEGTNSVGFNAYPAGNRSSVGYQNVSRAAIWYSTSQSGGDAGHWNAVYNRDDFQNDYTYKSNGLSVRCIAK